MIRVPACTYLFSCLHTRLCNCRLSMDMSMHISTHMWMHKSMHRSLHMSIHRRKGLTRVPLCTGLLTYRHMGLCACLHIYLYLDARIDKEAATEMYTPASFCICAHAYILSPCTCLLVLTHAYAYVYTHVDAHVSQACLCTGRMDEGMLRVDVGAGSWATDSSLSPETDPQPYADPRCNSSNDTIVSHSRTGQELLPQCPLR